MGTFQKLLPITSSRKLEVRLLSLLAYRKDNNNSMKKYSSANGLSSLKMVPKVEGLRLKCCIQKENPENSISGRKPRVPAKNSPIIYLENK